MDGGGSRRLIIIPSHRIHHQPSDLLFHLLNYRIFPSSCTDIVHQRYDPSYQPFTSDTDGKFSYAQQPQESPPPPLIPVFSFIIAIIGMT